MKQIKREIWKDIKDFEGLYQVSSFGQIRSLERITHYTPNAKSKTKQHTVKEKIRKPSKKSNGYLQILLYKENKGYQKYIHRLVAEAFIENPNNYQTVNHKNLNKQDNWIDNLEWCSFTDNNEHARQNINFKSGKAIKIECTNIDTGQKEIIKDLLKWCKENGHDRASVYKVLSGKYAHHHRLDFKYID